MKKLTLIFVLLLSINSIRCQKFEPIPIDKQQHLMAGFIAGSVGFIVGYEITDNPERAFIYSVTTSILAGFAKELIDSKTHQFDTNDIIYTSVGGITAGYTFDILSFKYRKDKKKKLF